MDGRRTITKTARERDDTWVRRISRLCLNARRAKHQQQRAQEKRVQPKHLQNTA